MVDTCELRSNDRVGVSMSEGLEIIQIENIGRQTEKSLGTHWLKHNVLKTGSSKKASIA